MTVPRAPGVREPLTVGAFRGLRYAADRVTSTAAVTSPPYDVLDSDAVTALESVDPHNVVRLILPRDDSGWPEGRYEHAGRTLRDWVETGVLRAEDLSGLYVYEQSDGARVLQRGLIGAVGLHDPSDGVVLPHEDVMPGPVADRLELMRAARANIEPILLVYDGEGGATVEVIAGAVAATPLVQATTPDALTHRLWLLTDEAARERVASDLAGRQVMIADGHHRYAAYRALQAERRATDGPGPWDAGLALLVDLRAYPPYVGAIHRSVRGVDLQAAVAAAGRLFDIRALTVDPLVALPDLRPGELLLTGGDGDAVVLSPLDRTVVGDLVEAGHPRAWRDLDTAVLHHVLVDRVWGLGDEAVSYHHEAPSAIEAARSVGGVAVLLAPVPVAEVLAIAADGVRMPRKSTSFGPKPRTGLVLRSFDLG